MEYLNLYNFLTDIAMEDPQIKFDDFASCRPSFWGSIAMFR